MRISPLRSSYLESSFDTVKIPNPKPDNYYIQKYQHVGKNLIVLINYPDCNNYEGNKILVLKNKTIYDIISLKDIDPHFDIKNPINLVARLEPTEEGWVYAERLAKIWK